MVNWNDWLASSITSAPANLCKSQSFKKFWCTPSIWNYCVNFVGAECILVSDRGEQLLKIKYIEHIPVETSNVDEHANHAKHGVRLWHWMINWCEWCASSWMSVPAKFCESQTFTKFWNNPRMWSFQAKFCRNKMHEVCYFWTWYWRVWLIKWNVWSLCLQWTGSKLWIRLGWKM